MVAGPVLVPAVLAPDQPPALVERVEVPGGRHPGTATLLFHLSTRAGGRPHDSAPVTNLSPRRLRMKTGRLAPLPPVVLNVPFRYL
jgi:hypothetical protein